MNNMTFDQVSAVLNELVEQVTGQELIAPVNTKEFISVGQTALKTGTDALAMGISQVLDRTIFSVRPYYAKFRAMEVDSRQWGAWTRKVNYIDSDFVDDKGYPLADGQTVDQWTIRKPKVVQLNFYGQALLSDYVTVFQEQINNAMRGPDELGEFWTGALQNLSDRHEQKTEAIARANIMNAVTGIVAGGNASQVVHLLTEYNAETGLNLTATSVMAPDNYTPFMKWAYARIQTMRDRLTERLVLHHMNITGKEILRHTPYDKQVLYMYAPALRQMEARVLAGAFNEGRLEYRDIELVNYWQNPNNPGQVSGLPVYMGVDGDLIEKTGEAVTVNNVFAVLSDVDAMGVYRYSEGMATTPLNAAGRYYNMWHHWRWQSFVDMTENIVVFTLD